MKSYFLRLQVGITLFLAMTLFLIGSARAIEVRERQTAKLVVNFKAANPVFKKNEAIQFKVKGNTDFYLYIFSIDKEANKGYMLLPNDKIPDNKFKADQEYTLPEGDIEFYSNKVGTERIIMIASTEKLKIETSQYHKSGNFLEADMGQMEQSIKALGVREKADQGQVYQELDIVIVGE